MKTRIRREEHLDIRMTSAQREAVETQARRRALDASSWARGLILEHTDWNPDNDPEYLSANRSRK